MVEHNLKASAAKSNESRSWLALVIGNTRLHWGHFYRESLSASWHTPHLTQAAVHQLQQTPLQADVLQEIATQSPTDKLPSEIWIASAVPSQTALWLTPIDHPALSVQIVERSHIPLTNLYPTLGIDRAINLLGAGQMNGWPIVVIDAGTALTFTAGIEKQGKPGVYGGAILPGLRLQRESLAQKTAVLGDHIPAETQKNSTLPTRWAMDTEGAIASGLIYSITAALIDYLIDWWTQFPSGKAILTGGDAHLLHHYLQQRNLQQSSLQQSPSQQRTPELASRVLVNHELMFYGMQAYRHTIMTANTIAKS